MVLSSSPPCDWDQCLDSVLALEPQGERSEGRMPREILGKTARIDASDERLELRLCMSERLDTVAVDRLAREPAERDRQGADVEGRVPRMIDAARHHR